MYFIFFYHSAHFFPFLSLHAHSYFYAADVHTVSVPSLNYSKVKKDNPGFVFPFAPFKFCYWEGSQVLWRVQTAGASSRLYSSMYHFQLVTALKCLSWLFIC